MLELDHLVIATPDLNMGCEYVANLFGVRPSAGGSHPGIGTRNALLGLTDNVYLEVIAPDPAQADDLPLSRYLGNLAGSHLSWWAARCKDIDQFRQEILSHNINCDEVQKWSRGDLSWRLLMPDSPKYAATLPFFIQWDDIARHPSQSAVHGGQLNALRITHPDAESLQRILGNQFDVFGKAEPGFTAELETLNGPVVLSTPAEAAPAIGGIQ